MNIIRFITRSALLACFSVSSFSIGFSAPPPPVGGYTLVVLPDTQGYAWKRPDIYVTQTRWIADNAAKYNISYVVHVGDLTEHNSPDEWLVARQAHDYLQGKVPYALLPGNHDYVGPKGKSASRETLLSEYFPLEQFQQSPGFGGVYDREPTRTENSYHLFEASGRKWLILALEFGPRDDVLRWANEVVWRHPDRLVMMATHAYLRADNSRFDRNVPVAGERSPNKGADRYASEALVRSREGFNDGEDIWRKLVSLHRNFVLVVSGHVTITGRLTSIGVHGNPVHQLLVNYQSIENGGNGFLRLLQFLPDGKTLRVRDYSPLLDETSAEADRTFDLVIPGLGDGG